jgi:histidinol-phosphate aminotransferase
MRGYSSGEQPAPGERIIKLNTNENPFPPSPRVMEAIRNVDPEALRRYPNPTAEPFRLAAAKLLGVAPEMILCGNGSDDILTIATRSFIAPGGTLAYAEPTYSLYPVLSALEGARVAAVPWGADWRLPVEALIATGADAVYLANPNAPSGTLVPPATVASLARGFAGAVLVDEAYVDFADENCLQLVHDYPNVIVSRTLSKAYALAGLRFGYAVARPEVIDQMLKVKDSYNCDAISIAAATAAIEDQDYARRSWDHVRNERTRLSMALTELGFAVIPSQANFVLAGVPGGQARQLYLELKQQGILVRYFDLPGLSDKIRLTLGTTEENDAVLEALRGA